MLPKLERLKDRRFFNLVFNKKHKKSRKIASSLLILYYFLSEGKDINRFNSAIRLSLPKTAFVVGLKVDKKSTIRNLIKRRMRAAYQLVKKKLINTIQNKFSILIWIATPSIKNATFEQIKIEMEHLFTKIQ